MTRNEIIGELRNYFQIRELVCRHTYSQWGERSWQFLDTDYLECLLIIRRDILKRAMVCNTNTQNQRGLRCNLCQIVKNKDKLYISSHILGKAGDFTVQGMTAQEARQRIKDNAHLLPYPLRMEAGVSWLHFDVLPQYGVDAKIYEFLG